MAVRVAQQSVIWPRMSRRFISASNDYLASSTTPVTAVPCSMSCWFRSTRATDHETLICIADFSGGAGGQIISLKLRGDVGGDPVTAHVYDGGTSYASSSTGFTVGKWQHGLAVFAANDDRRVYLDGRYKGTNAVSRTPAGISDVSIGAVYRNGMPFARYYRGYLTQAAIWNCALTDVDAFLLASGRSPLEIERRALVSYWPLVEARTSGDRDVIGPHDMAPFGGPPTWHTGSPKTGVLWQTPDIYPLVTPPAAGGGTIPVMMRYYRNMRT